MIGTRPNATWGGFAGDVLAGRGFPIGTKTR
jgi:hypothetical protein